MKKKYLALLVLPVFFALAPMVHADATSSDATTTVSSGNSYSHGGGGSSVLLTSQAQKIEVIKYKLSLLLAEWMHIFGVAYPKTK